MADTFSPLLRLRLQQTGANTNTWGALLNSAALQLIEDAIAGTKEIIVASSDVTLSTANGASDEARMAVLKLTGSPGAPRNIIVPALSKTYVVANRTGETMTIKTATGSGVAVPDGATEQVYCDGIDVVAVTTEEATDFVELADGSTVTVDCTAGTRFFVTIDGNRTIVLSNPVDGQSIELWIQQDEDGNRTVSWPGNVQWEEGRPPRLSTAAGAIDRFQLTYHADEDLWIGRAGAQPQGFLELTDAATISVDCRLADVFFVTLGGNRILQLSNPQDGQQIEIWIAQDAAGNRTITWPANVRFEGGSSSVLSTAAEALDRFVLRYHATLDIWAARSGLGVSAGSGGVSSDLVIDQNTYEVRVFDLLGQPAEAVTVTVTVNPGVVVRSHSTSVPAMDFAGFAVGSTINLINHGYILGCGGDGGRGAFRLGGNEDHTFRATPGRAGGPAIRGPGSGRTFNITNADGFIWGGGGGGGGGGCANLGSGGGGGGGAGGGKGGVGFQANYGNDGTTGPNGQAGTGGSASNDPNRGGGPGATGGAGGDWGQSGGAGQNGSTANGASGGAGGKAVDANGGTVTFLAGGSNPNVKGSVS